MKQFGHNLAYVLTITFGLIGGTTGASIPFRAGVTQWVLQTHLLEDPMPNPLCCPGYNDMPPTWNSSQFHPIVQELQTMIETDAEIYMGFTQMFDEIPSNYTMDYPGIGPQIRDYQHMLYRLNRSLEWSPPYGKGSTTPTSDNFYPLPITNLFYWSSCTSGGYRMFTNEKVNDWIRRFLNTWNVFLSSSGSLCSLTTADQGWFSPAALDAFNQSSGTPFAELYECKPQEPSYGFRTWDEFFTRNFSDIAKYRPVDSPNDTRVITNPCESTPYNITHNVQELDTFWIKGEPYSLRFMLNNDSLTDDFINGTIIQSYLATLDYHRWHSPVDGTIKNITSVPGTYFAFSTRYNFTNGQQPNPAGDGDWSQKYMSNVATRMIFFIEADNEDIGMMAVIMIGMGEVSSCKESVVLEQHVTKGEELGSFHFGGSTYAMVFRNTTNINFTIGDPVQNFTRVYLNRQLGVVTN